MENKKESNKKQFTLEKVHNDNVLDLRRIVTKEQKNQTENQHKEDDSHKH